MSAAEDSGNGLGAQLAARLVALGGNAPQPVCYVVFRSTRRADGTRHEGYTISDATAPLDPPGFDAWLMRQPSGVDRLAIAVLVIREMLDARELIQHCILERRRGFADGPFCGDPARVEFVGAAGSVRQYRSRPDGTLVVVAPAASVAAPRARLPEQLAGEHKVLEARFGDTLRVLEAREPTVFEDMAGLSGIVHVRTPDGREIGCGIGWHGTMPFILEAGFPRFVVVPELSQEQAAAVDAAVRAGRLVRGGTRRDERGLAVAARRRGSEALLLLRPNPDGVREELHSPSRDAAGPDQQRWMHYVATYEGLLVLDAWLDGSAGVGPIAGMPGGGIVVLTGDATGELWRHHVDADGVETWRTTEADAAFGALHRERLYTGTLALEVGETSDEHDAASIPSISLRAQRGSC